VNKDNAKDLRVLNIASALPFTIAPAILAIGSGSYGFAVRVRWGPRDRWRRRHPAR
jgi:hypothetical protein